MDMWQVTNETLNLMFTNKLSCILQLVWDQTITLTDFNLFAYISFLSFCEIWEKKDTREAKCEYFMVYSFGSLQSDGPTKFA